MSLLILFQTVDVSDVVEILCTRNNAAMSELKESYRKGRLYAGSVWS